MDRGDHFVVNGQKVWTSGAHFAHWIILLARTNPEAPKHQGISCLLIPMTTPRDHRAPARPHDRPPPFQRGLPDDVVVPRASLLGPLDQGWKVATTTLMHERHSAGGRNHAAQIERLLALARRVRVDEHPAWEDPRPRQRLAQLVIESAALK